MSLSIQPIMSGGSTTYPGSESTSTIPKPKDSTDNTSTPTMVTCNKTNGEIIAAMVERDESKGTWDHDAIMAWSSSAPPTPLRKVKIILHLPGSRTPRVVRSPQKRSIVRVQFKHLCKNTNSVTVTGNIKVKSETDARIKSEPETDARIKVESVTDAGIKWESETDVTIKSEPED